VAEAPQHSDAVRAKMKYRYKGGRTEQAEQGRWYPLVKALGTQYQSEAAKADAKGPEVGPVEMVAHLRESRQGRSGGL
jgi:hypothetical protein